MLSTERVAMEATGSKQVGESIRAARASLACVRPRFVGWPMRSAAGSWVPRYTLFSTPLTLLSACASQSQQTPALITAAAAPARVPKKMHVKKPQARQIRAVNLVPAAKHSPTNGAINAQAVECGSGPHACPASLRFRRAKALRQCLSSPPCRTLPTAPLLLERQPANWLLFSLQVRTSAHSDSRHASRMRSSLSAPSRSSISMR